jgi:hypothetical protein
MRRADPNPAGRTRKGLAIAAAIALLAASGLSSAGKKYVEATQADGEIPSDELLDVSIEVFDPGLPEEDPSALEEEGIYPGVRKSEARYIPFLLKNTLESTGNWGAVRVMPAGGRVDDVVVSGEILESNGHELALRLRVVDSRGREWRDRTYKQDADAAMYAEDAVEIRDPYQSLYNRIANDMLASRKKLDRNDFREIRWITHLRFGADLAPLAFEDYLSVNRKGRWKIEKLPAEDDPMLARIDRIREQDYLFVDTLNEYYADFRARMDGPYDEWRQFSYEEEEALREIRRKARLQKALGGLLIALGVAAGASDSTDSAAGAAVLGGTLVVMSGVETAKEGKIHRAAIQELAGSFDAEIEPVRVEVEGRTLKLEGSAEAQYAEWRELLREIFVSETGLPPEPDAPGAAGTD